MVKPAGGRRGPGAGGRRRLIGEKKMTRRTLIWLVALIVASLSWALFLVRSGWLYPEERVNLLVDVISTAVIPLMFPSIVVGIAFVSMKARGNKEISVTALCIATSFFLTEYVCHAQQELIAGFCGGYIILDPPL